MSRTRMISWRDYGYRMIGAGPAELRAEMVRARYMGQTLDLSSSAYHRAGTTTSSGESFTFTPAPPPPPPAPRRVIALRLGTSPTRAAAPVTAPAPTADAAPAPAPAPDACQCETVPRLLAAGGAGALVGGLIMYFVGLSTREKRKGRR